MELVRKFYKQVIAGIGKTYSKVRKESTSILSLDTPHICDNPQDFSSSRIPAIRNWRGQTKRSSYSTQAAAWGLFLLLISYFKDLGNVGKKKKKIIKRVKIATAP